MLLETTTPLSESDRTKIRALPWALASGVLSNFFLWWTFGGSIFVLFLNELGFRADQIGLIQSFFPFCGLLALGIAPIATRLGRKRVFLICYGLRNPVIALLLILPWFLPEYRLTVLIGIIATFAALRSVAETAYYPWWQEFIPNAVRGRFSAWSTVLGLLASILAMAIAAKVLSTPRANPTAGMLFPKFAARPSYLPPSKSGAPYALLIARKTTPL